MFKIAKKDLMLFVSDKKGMLLTFLLPITLITLFALAFGGTGTKKSKPVNLPVIDMDLTAESKDVVKRLDSVSGLKTEKLTLAEAEKQVKKGNRAALLLIGKGFSDSLQKGKKAPLELRYDQSREAEIGILQAALMGNLMQIVGLKSIEADALKNVDQQYSNFNKETQDQIKSDITENFRKSGTTNNSGMPELKMTPLINEKQNSPGLVQAVAGTAIMMLLFSVAAIGATLLEEKQEGTLKRLLYSPLSANNILFGKMLSANIIAIAQLTIMFLFTWLVFGLDIFNHLPSLIVMIIATAYACSSFGVFLASIAKSRSQVQGLSTLIILVMSAIGGSMIPSFVMPEFMQKLGVISVNYWGIQGFYDIFWRGLEFTDPTFLSRIAVLLAIGTALNFIATRLFRKNILSLQP